MAKPVVNDRGMTLCGEGTELNEETIGRLSRMDVKQISVKGNPLKTGKEAKSLSQQVDELNNRFKRVERDPLMKKIKETLLKVLEEGAEEA